MLSNVPPLNGQQQTWKQVNHLVSFVVVAMLFGSQWFRYCQWCIRLEFSSAFCILSFNLICFGIHTVRFPNFLSSFDRFDLELLLLLPWLLLMATLLALSPIYFESQLIYLGEQALVRFLLRKLRQLIKALAQCIARILFSFSIACRVDRNWKFSFATDILFLYVLQLQTTVNTNKSILTKLRLKMKDLLLLLLLLLPSLL